MMRISQKHFQPPNQPPSPARLSESAPADFLLPSALLSFEDLLRSIRKHADFPASCAALRRFVDGPQFFENFLYGRDKHLGRFRFRLFLQNEKFREGNLGPDAWRCFVQYLRQKYKNLDQLVRDPILAKALGLWSTRQRAGLSGAKIARRLAAAPRDIAKACVDLGIFERRIPDGHSFGGGNRRSFYLMPEVVDGAAQTNREIFLRAMFPNLDSVAKDTITKVALAVLRLPRQTSVKLAARALIEQGIISARIPDNYVFNGSHISHYFRAEIVGHQTAVDNMKEYCRNHYPDLDRVERDGGFAAALGLDRKQTVRDLARRLVQLGWISPEIPPCRPLLSNRTHCSRYFDADIVGGHEQAVSNLKKWAQAEITRPEDISQPALLWVLLQKAKHRSMLTKAPHYRRWEGCQSRERVFRELSRLGWVTQS